MAISNFYDLSPTRCALDVIKNNFKGWSTFSIHSCRIEQMIFLEVHQIVLINISTSFSLGVNQNVFAKITIKLNFSKLFRKILIKICTFYQAIPTEARSEHSDIRD